VIRVIETLSNVKAKLEKSEAVKMYMVDAYLSMRHESIGSGLDSLDFEKKWDRIKFTGRQVGYEKTRRNL
jgi:hypothetical protein